MTLERVENFQRAFDWFIEQDEVYKLAFDVDENHEMNGTPM